ncbi:MAG: TolC family protein [Desulfarculaceae bacterium]|nr:TolC family protein [Desulfarculaceae bacterium]MCF8071955.1 TolC family protein [Desulfarculaceae bacterium]MCF8101472.1 TolC family protein [Desulfarculaceae bacterium]MCF8115022.1 TolC family protein [Desulfarculaceae bacterium]
MPRPLSYNRCTGGVGTWWSFCLLVLLLWSCPALAAPPQLPSLPGGGTGDTLDMSLPEAVFLAVRGNTDIKNAYLDRVVQKFQLEVAEAKFTPDVTFDANLKRSGSDYSEDQDGFSDTSDTNDTQVNATASVNQTLPTGAQFTFSWQFNKTTGDTTGSYNSSDDSTSNSWQIEMQQPILRGGGIDVNLASVRQARISEQQNILGLKATLISTVTTTIYNYRSFLESVEQIKIALRSLKRAYQLLEENKALISAGRMAKSDLVQSQSNLANQRIAYQQALNQLQQNRLELLRTLNMSKTTKVLPTEGFNMPQDLPTMDQALALAYANQPAYLQAKLVVATSKQDLLLAENNMLWDLNLLVNYNRSITDSDQGGHADQSDWSAGLYLSVPVYGPTRLSRRSQLLSARSNILKADNSLKQAEENLLIDVDNSLRDLKIKKEQVKLSQEALKLSQQQLSNEQEKLKYGRSSNFQVVSYQLDLANSELTLLSAKVEYLNSLVALDQTLGTTLNTWRIAFKTQRKQAVKKVWDK